MRFATRSIAPEQIDYVNAHGTSTAVGRRIETTAIKRAFGEHAYKLAVSSTKSMTGHLLGGAGGLEAGITVLALRDQIAPPTINLRDVPDPECDLDYVPNHARPMKIDYALSNSFGFGGTNGCLVFQALQVMHGPKACLWGIVPADCPNGRTTHLPRLLGERLMKIIVPSSRSRRATLSSALPRGRWIQESDLSFEINEPDAYALEEALR